MDRTPVAGHNGNAARALFATVRSNFSLLPAWFKTLLPALERSMVARRKSRISYTFRAA